MNVPLFKKIGKKDGINLYSFKRSYYNSIMQNSTNTPNFLGTRMHGNVSNYPLNFDTSDVKMKFSNKRKILDISEHSIVTKKRKIILSEKTAFHEQEKCNLRLNQIHDVSGTINDKVIDLNSTLNINLNTRPMPQTIIDFKIDDELNNIIENYIGPMNVKCCHCQAKHFEKEKSKSNQNSFDDCCNHGKVELEPLPDFPYELQSLFENTHQKSNIFFKNIRRYNNSFAFASFNANLISFAGNRPGPYCFKIQGQIYYQMNTAFYPTPN